MKNRVSHRRSILSKGWLIALGIIVGIGITGCKEGTDSALEQPVEVTTETDLLRQRTVDGNVFTSTYVPPIRVQIDEAFTYVGHVEFILKNIAHADLHVFVEAEGAHIERMIVLHFEGFLDDNTYNYRITNPVTLGEATYNQNTFFFDNAVAIAQNPDAEMARITTLLREQDYTLDDELMTSRFVRVVGEDRRNELILFYYENVRDTGHTLDEISMDGGVRSAYIDLANDLTQRSLHNFTVLKDD